MAPSYFSSKMNIMVAEDLYPESLEGDEPEPLPQVRWPLAQLMLLLDEAIVSALFLVRERQRAVFDAECLSGLGLQFMNDFVQPDNAFTPYPA